MPRQALDPFVEGPLQPNPGALRTQASQQSLRSNASTASTRTRQQRELFAPALLRRPTSRTTPRVADDDVLEDHADSESEMRAAHRQRRRIRHASPEGKYGLRVKAKLPGEEESEFVNRQVDGGYLLGMSPISPTSETGAPQFYTPEMEEEAAEKEEDAQYASLARFYFSSGFVLGGRGSKKQEEEFEARSGPMMMRLREQAMMKIESERWMFEDLDPYQAGLR